MRVRVGRAVLPRRRNFFQDEDEDEDEDDYRPR